MGGLSQNPVEEGGQATGSVNNHTNDLTTVHNGLLAEVNTGQFSGAALGHVQAILSDINTAISAANASVNSAVGRQHGRRRTSAPRQPSRHPQYRQVPIPCWRIRGAR